MKKSVFKMEINATPLWQNILIDFTFTVTSTEGRFVSTVEGCFSLAISFLLIDSSLTFLLIQYLVLRRSSS